MRALVIQLLLLPLRFYKWAVSPLLPPTCRFHPSCSVYAMGAIAVHGPLQGVWLAARRVTRCHPFHPGGLDPVPPRGEREAVAILEVEEPELAARMKAPPHPLVLAALAHQPPKRP